MPPIFVPVNPALEPSRKCRCLGRCNLPARILWIATAPYTALYGAATGLWVSSGELPLSVVGAGQGRGRKRTNGAGCAWRVGAELPLACWPVAWRLCPLVCRPELV